ncbi:hypothetical protein MLD38_024707 [Melastoma candidum]|uniref:Uncharacterized protein n=1 Tax=Melastoma candidum TaxID=119954 RepID=A0ACB9NT71_9MYRT|nr:hypothetical protein MLD38_024707 [Melastoma candidum]
MKFGEETGTDHGGGWLGFSLSPRNGVSAAEHSPAAGLLSHQSYSDPPLFFGVCGENGGGYSSSLSVMPLKSDGSPFLSEAMSRPRTGSQSVSTPKLEDFLGGTVEAPSVIPLGLDTSMYYQQNQPQSQFFWYPHDFTPASAMFQPALTDDGVLGNQHPPVQVVSSGESVGAIGCADLQHLSLSMSPGSQLSCVTAPRQISPGGTDCVAAMEITKKRAMAKQTTVHRKSIDSFGQRTSQYRGVTRHRWTGRYEAHLWDNSCKKEGQSRKGRQGDLS